MPLLRSSPPSGSRIKTALFPDQLRVEYRHFPLEQHTRAKPAAIASECANQQGMFWKYHDYLYENPRALQDSDLLAYAQKTKLDLNGFKTCLTSKRASQAVTRDTQIAQNWV